ncbi:MAG: class 1 fructose-bisphosphatase [Anaerolineales bacterium]|nr:class 1 fructose-bisphosphatase [Anaerolineae bacterium]MBL6982579.1 class 1 fructose-bisphosphatase [Anaerolineales bacterium]
MLTTKIVTIERFLLDTQPDYARGDLTALLYDLALAAKVIASQTRRAGLLDILGFADNVNIQGEEQRKLDVYADDIVVRLNDHTGRLCSMVSEEREDWIPIPAKYPKGHYVLVFDPLDGSSNIDTNISVGTIFGIYRALDDERRGRLEDCLQPGRDMVAAGYILYGTSTMLVYSAGQGVHGFTLDPAWGEFLLSHEGIRFPEAPKYYSFNHASAGRWSKPMKQYVDWLSASQTPILSQRYLGSMVADFHRNLIHGGVFGYPDEYNKPDGKIRLLYEAAPLAFLAEQAGGYGSDGKGSLLDIRPTHIHQRTPVFIGNRNLVEKAEAFIVGS